MSLTYLRLAATHLPLYLDWFNSQDLLPFLFPSTPRTKLAISAWLLDTTSHHHYYLIYFNQLPIGHVGLKLHHDTSDTAEIAIIIALPQFRHHGFGTQAFHFIAQLARQLGYPHLQAEILPSNAASLSFFTRHHFIPISSTPALITMSTYCPDN